MLCKKCNKKIDENSMFCKYCGKKILDNKSEKNMDIMSYIKEPYNFIGLFYILVSLIFMLLRPFQIFCEYNAWSRYSYWIDDLHDMICDYILILFPIYLIWVIIKNILDKKQIWAILYVMLEFFILISIFKYNDEINVEFFCLLLFIILTINHKYFFQKIFALIRKKS